MRLERHYVEKPWGRTCLPPIFDPPPGARVGEVWFTADRELPLLAKYIFTSERLSIQVHPNDQQARARGLPHGKNECWYILDAEPGATLGLGFTRELSSDELRAAALDGSIEQLIDWRPVVRGDFVVVPAGTVHAIGAGISLLEFQQNSDVTYRLYDYGRPRELHLDDGIAVASLEPMPKGAIRHPDPHEGAILVDGPHFVLLHSRGDALREKQRWVLPLEGQVRCANETAGAGECLLVEAGEALESENARLLIGAKA